MFDELTLSRGISSARISRYFEQQGKRWQLKNEIRQRVMFREFNLLRSYASLLLLFHFFYLKATKLAAGRNIFPSLLVLNS